MSLPRWSLQSYFVIAIARNWDFSRFNALLFELENLSVK